MVRKLSVCKIGFLALVLSCAAFSFVYAVTPSEKALDKGVKLLTAGKFDEAMRAFNKTKALDPNNAGAYWGLGVCASAKGQTDEAIVLLNKAIELDPTQGGFYENRAVAYSMKKEYAKAWADVRVANALGRQLSPEFMKGLEKASNPASKLPVPRKNAKT